MVPAPSCGPEDDLIRFWDVYTPMADTQIPLSEETREKLRWVKLLSMSQNYDEAIRRLVEESGFEVPDEPVSEASFKRLVVEAD